MVSLILIFHFRDPYDSIYSYKVKEYDDKIKRTYMPFDSSRKLYLEFDGYTTGQQNFETWVPYLNYPLQLPLEYNEKKVMLDSYSSVIKQSYNFFDGSCRLIF